MKGRARERWWVRVREGLDGGEVCADDVDVKGVQDAGRGNLFSGRRWPLYAWRARARGRAGGGAWDEENLKGW